MRSIQRYYEDQKAWLVEAGREFAEANPGLKTFLRGEGTGVGDPHVDRVLEAVAFLSARLERRLDDSLLTLADDLLQICYPGMLEPQPAMVLTRMNAKPALGGVRRVEAGVSVVTDRPSGASKPIELLTVDDVVLTWLGVTEVSFVETALGDKTRLHLKFATLNDAPLDKHTDLPGRLAVLPHWANFDNTCSFYAAVRKMEDPPTVVGIGEGGARIQLANPPVVAFKSPGAYEPILEDEPNQYPGMRLMREFLALPQRFLAVEIVGLNECKELTGAWGIALDLVLPVPLNRLPRFTKDNFLLHTAAAVNRWPATSRSINYDGSKVLYDLSPDRPRGGEIMKVNGVRALKQGSKEFQQIPPFDYFDRESACYVTRHESTDFSDSKSSTKWQLELRGLDTERDRRRILADLTGCDREATGVLELTGNLANKEGLPPDVSISILGAPSAFAPAMSSEAEYWELVDLLSANLTSLGDVRRVRRLLTHLNRSRNKVSTRAIRAILDVRVEADFTTVDREPVKVFRMDYVMARRDEISPEYWQLFFDVFHYYLKGLLPLNTRLWLRVFEERKKEPILEWKPSMTNIGSGSSID